MAETFPEFGAAAEHVATAADLYTTGGRRPDDRDHRPDRMVRSGGLSIVEAGLRNRNMRFPWPDAGRD